LQGGCEGPKVVLFFSITWMSYRERLQEPNFCFGLVCKVIVEVKKIKNKKFTCMGLPHGKNIRDKILFGLVCKVVMEVQRSFFFSCTWVSHVKQLEVFICFLILSTFS